MSRWSELHLVQTVCVGDIKIPVFRTWRMLPDESSHSLKWAWMTEWSSRFRSSSSCAYTCVTWQVYGELNKGQHHMHLAQAVHTQHGNICALIFKLHDPRI